MTTKYLKVCPRGFANEYVILRVPSEKVSEANAQFDGYENDVERWGYTAWVDAPTDPCLAVDWADRHMVL